YPSISQRPDSRTTGAAKWQPGRRVLVEARGRYATLCPALGLGAGNALAKSKYSGNWYSGCRTTATHTEIEQPAGLRQLPQHDAGRNGGSREHAVDCARATA